MATLNPGRCLSLFACGFLAHFTLAAAASQTPARISPGPASAEAKKALADFQLKDGFRLELVVSEPMVESPVAIAFDENGRLFVAEMRDYPDRRGVTPHLGRVRLLEDTDGDGAIDSSTVYADDLPMPSGLACYGGGVFVITTPDLVYLKDSKKDGFADVRQVVLTGLGGTNAPASTALPNSLTWGLENRLYAVSAGVAGTLSASNWPSASPVSLEGHDFSFDPRTLQPYVEPGMGSSGMTFDNSGRRFVSDFSRPLRVVLASAAQNPFSAPSPELMDVLGPGTTLIRSLSDRFSPGEIANPAVLRTNKATFAPFTNASGCCVYRGALFPSNYLQNVFIAAPDAHLVHRSVLVENGLQLSGRRAREDFSSEFLVCQNSSFRPVQLTTGPEGALYIADMQLDRAKGRIYRVVPSTFKAAPRPQLGKATTYELVSALAHPDGWHRDTAARLLFERRDPAAAGLLTNMLDKSRLPLARLHALHALEGSGSLSEPSLMRGLADPDERIRHDAVSLACQTAGNAAPSQAVWKQLSSMANDPSVRVRYQLASSIGSIRRPDKGLVLAELARSQAGNTWFHSAAMQSSTSGGGRELISLVSDSGYRGLTAGQAYMRQLATMLGTQGSMEEVAPVVDFLARGPVERIHVYALLAALGDGLQRTRSSLALINNSADMQRTVTEAVATAIDDSANADLRAEAVRLTGVSVLTYADTSDWLLVLCGFRDAPRLQLAAIETLGRFDDPRVVNGLLDRWTALSLPMRNQAVAAMLSRANRIPLVLDALQAGSINRRDFSSTEINRLRTCLDGASNRRALGMFGPVPQYRPETARAYWPALTQRGVVERGRQLFLSRCANCHTFGASGRALGPDLTTARHSGKRKLLSDILEPNASLAPQYQTCTILTGSGELSTGVKQSENSLTVILGQPDKASVVWPRLNIRTLTPEPWSMMPDKIEQGWSVQDMADLLEFLVSAPGT